MRGESIEEGRAEEDEERFERASLRGEELECLDEGKGLVVWPFLGKEIRSAVAGEGRERGEDGKEERQVVEELGELCKEEVSVRREE